MVILKFTKKFESVSIKDEEINNNFEKLGIKNEIIVTGKTM